MILILPGFLFSLCRLFVVSISEQNSKSTEGLSPVLTFTQFTKHGEITCELFISWIFRSECEANTHSTCFSRVVRERNTSRKSENAKEDELLTVDDAKGSLKAFRRLNFEMKIPSFI